jgi:hypothetical protein
MIKILFIALVLLPIKNFAQVTNGRAIVAVVNLDHHAKFKTIYKLETLVSSKRIKKWAHKAYEEVIVLNKSRATRENFLREIQRMNNSSSIKRIDVIFYLHGFGPQSRYGSSLCFVGEPCTPTKDLSKQILDHVDYRTDKLRMVYSDACWGADHLTDLESAGFKTVAGAIGVDSNHSADLRRFLSYWVNGKSFQDSIDHANAFKLTPILDRILKDGNSFKVVAGDQYLTIQD